MELSITTEKNAVLTTTLERRIRRQLSEALDPHEGRISSVEVHLSVKQSGDGEVMKSCRAVVNLRPQGTLTVEESASRALIAVLRATGRIQEAVDKRLFYPHAVKIVSDSEPVTVEPWSDNGFYIENWGN